MVVGVTVPWTHMPSLSLYARGSPTGVVSDSLLILFRWHKTAHLHTSVVSELFGVFRQPRFVWVRFPSLAWVRCSYPRSDLFVHPIVYPWDPGCFGFLPHLASYSYTCATPSTTCDCPTCDGVPSATHLASHDMWGGHTWHSMTCGVVTLGSPWHVGRSQVVRHTLPPSVVKCSAF